MCEKEREGGGAQHPPCTSLIMGEIQKDLGCKDSSNLQGRESNSQEYLERERFIKKLRERERECV